MVHAVHPESFEYRTGSSLPRFEIHADREPQTLARIVGIFAAQNLVPTELNARHSCAGMWVALHVDMDSDRAERAAEKLRALACVEAVIFVPVPAAGLSGCE